MTYQVVYDTKSVDRKSDAYGLLRTKKRAFQEWTDAVKFIRDLRVKAQGDMGTVIVGRPTIELEA